MPLKDKGNRFVVVDQKTHRNKTQKQIDRISTVQKRLKQTIN